MLYTGLSDRPSVSDFASNTTQGSRDNLSGLETYGNECNSTEVPVSVRAPVTVTASEVIPSFPITTMAGTMSRSAEGFVTLSKLGYGVTTSRITLSTLTVPSDLTLAYGYANISYTGPRDSFHLPDPIFPPMRFSGIRRDDWRKRVTWHDRHTTFRSTSRAEIPGYSTRRAG